MLREEAEYPSQSAMTYLRRVLKCSLLLAFTTPLLYGIIIRTLGLLGIEHDEVGMEAAAGGWHPCLQACASPQQLYRTAALSSFNRLKTPQAAKNDKRTRFGCIHTYILDHVLCRSATISGVIASTLLAPATLVGVPPDANATLMSDV